MFEVRLSRIRELSESTRDFQFIREDGEKLHYKPGQFYRFVFEDEEGEFERSYSLCNFDELYGDQLDLMISKVEGGRATQLLFNCEEGLSAKVTGPYGRLVLPEQEPDRLVMVATSVGLAPFVPILKELELRSDDRKVDNVVLLLGVRDRSEFIYGDLLRSYAIDHDWFEVRFCISRESPRVLGDSENDEFPGDEFPGYVTDQLKTLDVSSATDHVLLCGNPAMIDDAWTFLKEQGFKSKQVVREKYVFAREKKKAASSLTDDQKKLIAEKMKKYT